MKLNLPIVYTVNREERSVTAKFLDRHFDFYKYVNMRSPCYVKHVLMEPPKMEIDHCVATAKCAPDDVFDEVIGKKIARRRLLRYFYTDLIDNLRRLIKRVDTAKAGLTIQLNNVKSKKYDLLDELHDIYDFPEKHTKKFHK